MMLVIAGVILVGLVTCLYAMYRPYKEDLVHMEAETARLRLLRVKAPHPVARSAQAMADPFAARVKDIERQLMRGGVAEAVAHAAAVEQAKRETA
jgi:hypothetical protein